MVNPKKRLLRSAPVLVIGAIWEFLNHWSLLDAFLTKLRAQGATGVLIANSITSPPLRLTLIAFGFVMIAKAYFFPEANVAEESAKAVPAEKELASPIVTPEYIVGFFKDHTHIQAESLVKPLIGQMMEVSGSISDISSGWDYILVQITDPNGVNLALAFSKTWADKLSILKKTHNIVAIGKITMTNSYSVHLEDCELKSTYA